MGNIVAIILLAPYAIARNPLVPGAGMADPHARTFQGLLGGKVFIFATHDFAPNNTGFEMHDWNVWSTSDLRKYTKESTLVPMPWVPASARHECWATDAAEHNGKIYWYVSVGPTEIAVLRQTPGPGGGLNGTWDDPLGKPLLSSALGQSLNPPTSIRDPGLFQDQKTGDYYIIFGTFNYYIAKLADDMVSLAERPRLVIVKDALGNYGPGKTDDKPFIHFRKGMYYLSYGCFYAISSKSVYGPYEFVGAVIATPTLAPAFRMPQTNASVPWWAHEDLRFRHGSFLSLHGQWYFFTNDRSHSDDLAYPGYYRDTVAGYVHFYPNGSIAPVKIDAVGIGEFDGDQFIEAENFFAKRTSIKMHSPGDSSNDFFMSNITNASVLDYLCVRPPSCLSNPLHTLKFSLMTVREGSKLYSRNLTAHVNSVRNGVARRECSMDLQNNYGGIDRGGVRGGVRGGDGEVSCLMETSLFDGKECLDFRLQFEGEGRAAIDYIKLGCEVNSAPVN